MNLLLISIVVVGTSIQGIMQKAYNIKVSGGTYSFTAASVTAALVVFLISSGGRLQFRADVAVYAILFAVSYGSSIFCSLMSIRTGPLSISALITSYSLIIPSLCGILALGESVKKTMVAGIILLLVSLLLVNLKKDENEKKTSSKWWIYVIIAFIGGGMCSTVQKVQQVAFDGKYKSELMIVALSVTALIMFGAAFFSEKEKIATSLKKGLYGMQSAVLQTE